MRIYAEDGSVRVISTKTCRTCRHAIPHQEDYQGDDRDMACPEFGLVRETDSCGDWEETDEEE
ncbi:MAG: hypothetical protein WC455_21215 [Dehalococcoidia bacterium]|jgi:hypothetical protein